MEEPDSWSVQLQQKLREAVYEYVKHSWGPFERGSEAGFIADVDDTSTVIEGLEILNVDKTEPITRFYATVDQNITSTHEVHTLVHHLLSLVDEDFFVFVPLHDEEYLRFWYITGTQSHGHEGMILLKRSDISHVIY